MQITQCLHTAILVTNLERSEHFYSKVLALSKVERSLNFPGTWYQIGNYQIHLIVAPTTKSEPQQDLRTESPKPRSPLAPLKKGGNLKAPFLRGLGDLFCISPTQNEKWGRNSHIALSVVDLEAAKLQLLNYNCPIQLSASGRAALFTQDPDGNIIELSQV